MPKPKTEEEKIIAEEEQPVISEEAPKPEEPKVINDLRNP